MSDETVELGSDKIKSLVGPMLLRPLPEGAFEQLARYIRLLFRWNDRINLTAVRTPEVLVGLHIAECLRSAQLIPEEVSSVLDFGSGAGLPGIPIHIARPALTVVLAESQKKKAAFLKEAIRELDLAHATVHPGRVEDLPLDQTFDLVAMRAVDRMDRALRTAYSRIRPGGSCMVLTSKLEADSVRATLPALQWGMDAMPGTRQRVLLLGTRVP